MDTYLTIKHLINTFRSETADELPPPIADDDQPLDEDALWRTHEVIGYLSEAQIEIARRLRGIDAQEEFPLEEGVDTYKYPHYILEVAEGHIGEQRDIVTVHSFQSNSHFIEDDYGATVTRRFPTTTLGRPRVFIADEKDGYFRVWPVPDASYTMTLNVRRIPKGMITRTSDVLELDDPRYLRAYMHWMKHLAYDKHDADTRGDNLSLVFQDKFVLEMERMASERNIRARKPQPVRYGGIPF